MVDRNRNNEKQWIEAIGNGDEDAFENLFLTYYSLLCKFAWRYVRSAHIAEELVQDVFANIWEKKETLDPKGSIKAYLYQSVKNKALDHMRHQEVINKYLSERAKMEKKMVYQESIQPEETAFLKAARQAIEELPERARQVYKLHRKDGLTYSEIAEVMEISPKTVESQMSRALNILRSRLSRYLPLLATVDAFRKLFQ